MDLSPERCHGALYADDESLHELSDAFRHSKSQEKLFNINQKSTKLQPQIHKNGAWERFEPELGYKIATTCSIFYSRDAFLGPLGRFLTILGASKIKQNSTTIQPKINQTSAKMVSRSVSRKVLEPDRCQDLHGTIFMRPF